ncbi:MAG: hypothetical protein IH987_02250 [Planctomycetes bacterium]|nr:hypothetical protein [Planctomycetota bacterium]
MAILAGIDEAGYGPILGPLVVSGVAVRVPDERLGDPLWTTLRETITSKVTRSTGRRLAVADSKKLFRGRNNLAPLERAALVMLAAAGRHPKTWRGLLRILAPNVARQFSIYPWYAESDFSLPLSRGVGEVELQANAVRRDCNQSGVELMGMFCEPLLAGAFNRLVSNTRNKAVVLMGLALRIVDRIMRLAPNERVRVCIDRLGGRQHYRDVLMTTLPDYSLQIMEESAERSAYRLTKSSRICEVEFAVKSEERHFCVALASVYSKYLREVFMHAFNEYWAGHLKNVRPTAGYYTDAKRWLADACDAIEHAGIDRSILVRSR